MSSLLFGIDAWSVGSVCDPAGVARRFVEQHATNGS
jgi:hypothetical protein